MKILLISPFFAPVSTVAAARMTSLVKHLQNKHTVTVVTYDDTFYQRYPNFARKSPLVDGIRYVYFDPIYPVDRISHLKETERVLYYTLSDELEKEHYDIILLSSGPVFPEAVISRIGKKYKIPYVIDFRDLDILDFFFSKKQLSYNNSSLTRKVRRIIHDYVFQKFERKAVKRAVKIVVANPAHKDVLIRKYNLNPDKIVSILNGYDDNALNDFKSQPYEKDNHKFVIGIFGKISEYDTDRTQNLIRIFKRISEKYSNLIIWHIGSNDKSTADYAYQIGLSHEQYVHYGVMDYKDAMAIMQKADMFAMVFTHPNSLGTKIYDYIALNKPVVSMSVPGMAFEKEFSVFKNICISENDEVIQDFICHIINDKISVLDEHIDIKKYARSSNNTKYEELLTKLY